MTAYAIRGDRIPEEELVQGFCSELERMRDLALFSADWRAQQKYVIDYYLFHITLLTGVRISEAARLKWGDVFKNFLIVRQGKGAVLKAEPGKRKDPKSRTVYFGEKTRALFDNLRHVMQELFGERCGPTDGVFIGLRGQMTRWGLHDRLLYWRERLAFPKAVTFHSLRHYYATYCLENSVSLVMIQKQLGHVSIGTTSVYLHHTKKAREQLTAIT